MRPSTGLVPSPSACRSHPPSASVSTSNCPGTSTSVPSQSRQGFQPFAAQAEELHERFHGQDVGAEPLDNVRLDLPQHLEDFEHLHGARGKAEVTAQPVQGVRHDAALQVAAQVYRDPVRFAEVKRGENPLAGGHGVRGRGVRRIRGARTT